MLSDDRPLKRGDTTTTLPEGDKTWVGAAVPGSHTPSNRLSQRRRIFLEFSRIFERWVISHFKSNWNDLDGRKSQFTAIMSHILHLLPLLHSCDHLFMLNWILSSIQMNSRITSYLNYTRCTISYSKCITGSTEQLFSSFLSDSGNICTGLHFLATAPDGHH